MYRFLGEKIKWILMLEKMMIAIIDLLIFFEFVVLYYVGKNISTVSPPQSGTWKCI
jgi:hypothetical protein